MIKSRAIEILKTFSDEEFRRFGKFVDSPYFNENRKVMEACRILKNYHPDFSRKSFTKQSIYSKLYKGKRYNDGTMRKLLSAVSKLASEFIVHSALDKKNTFQKDLILLRGYDEKNLGSFFLKYVSSLDEEFKKIINIEDDYFKSNFEIEVAKLNFSLGRGMGGFDPQNVLTGLMKCSTYLICYCLITSFKLNQDILVTGVSYDLDYRNTIAYKFIESLGPEKFINSIKEYAPEFYPVIAIYFNRFMIASGKDESGEFYKTLKELVLSHIEKFSRFEKYNLMLFLENSCDEKILAGMDFRAELHSIHKEMLAKGLYTSEDKDFFPLIRFRKIIRNALSVNEFRWTEEFIKNFIDKLPEQYKLNMNYYAQAMLHFRSRKFDMALENISRVKFELYSLKFDVWVLKLCTEFELGYFEEAVYTIDSFRHLLKNDTNSPDWMKKRFLNFITYYQKILNLRTGRKTGFINTGKHINEIEHSKDILEKNWLLEKLRAELPELCS